MTNENISQQCKQLVITFSFIAGSLLLGGCQGGYSQDHVNREMAKERERLEYEFASLFLTGIVEQDYGGAQFLMEKHTPFFKGAKGPQAREEFLKNFVHSWLKGHGLGDSQVEAFHMSSSAPNSSHTIDFDHTGHFQLADSKRKVYYRLRTVSYRIRSFELSANELHIDAMLRQEE